MPAPVSRGDAASPVGDAASQSGLEVLAAPMNEEPGPGSCHGRHDEATAAAHAAQVRLYAGSVPTRLVMAHLPSSFGEIVRRVTEPDYHGWGSGEGAQ